MNLRVEDTILLKPYAIPWREDGYVHLPSWTPDDLDPWVVQRTAEIMDGWQEAGKMPSLMFATKQATDEFVQWRKEKRLPVPGWAPVGLGPDDRRIRKAYRELFILLNTKSVPDGRYTFKKGRILPLSADDE